MRTHLQLEGPDLEALLARVRDEHGPDARIVQADRVRTGGVGGFFAKERYEVSVEIETDEAGTGAAAGAPAGADPLLALADRADEAERARAGTPAPKPVAPAPEPAPPPVSTSSQRFAAVLARLARDTDEGERSFRPAEAFPPVPGEGTVRVLNGTPPADPPAPRSPARPPVQPTAAPSPVGPGGFVRVLSADEEAAAAPAPAVTPPPTRAPGRVTSLPRIEGTPVDALQLDPKGRAEAFPAAPAAPAAAASEPTVPEPIAPEPIAPEPIAPEPAPAVSAAPPVAETPAPERPTTAALTLADAVSAALPPLAAALRALPLPPEAPAGPGEVLVVAGDGVHAYPAACAIAESMGLDAKHVLLVAPTRLGVGVHHSRHFETSEAVEERVQRLREGETPVVLAVDAPLGTKGAAWAREIAASCSASALWMLADAGRKTEDLADQVARLGRVDGLVVHGADATRDPASVLALGVPVALLAGQRATRAVWSAFLTARILDDEGDE